MRLLISKKPKNRNFVFQEQLLSSGNLTKQPTILICDSGVGGLSIYHEIRQTFPDANYLYVFDNEAFPYGEKSEQFIIKRILAIVGAIWRLHKLDLIILACNTASTISLPALRKRYFCPIIGVVPAIKSAAELTRNGIIGLLATRATIKHSYTRDLIKLFSGNCKVMQLGMGELVNLAEAKLHGKIIPLSILSKLLHPLLMAKDPPDTIVLGCTHFPLLRQELQTVLLEGTKLVDSGKAIAKRSAWLMEHYIKLDNLQNKTEPNIAYCLADTPQASALIPVLLQYGFSSLIKLTC
ncbi:MAG: glutamate racemase [Sodalis sp. (in: enterobacteria)]